MSPSHAGQSPIPEAKPEVSHDEILDKLMTKLGEVLGQFTALRAEVANLSVKVNAVANKQHAESKVISEALGWSQDNGRKLDGLAKLYTNLTDEVVALRSEVAEIRERRERDTIPVPPPELDADERTTPGHRLAKRRGP
jgi:hypothetical protein